MKKIYIIITLFILASCWANTQNNVENTTKVLDPKIQAEKRTNALLKTATPEQKIIFSELDKAKTSWDIQKTQELLEEIKKMEEAKRLELDEAVKSWDNEKAKAIRKEMVIFSEVKY